MKVLTFVTSISLRKGGPSRSVPVLVRGLAEMGVEITLMTLWDDDMNADALYGSNARLKVFDRSFPLSAIKQFIIDEGFELIHMQSIWEMEYHKVAQIARHLGIPYVISPRGMLEPWCLSQRRWKKKLAMYLYQKRDLDCASCVLTTAEMEAENVQKLGIKTHVAVIPNGLDTHAYQMRSNPRKVKKQVLFLSRIQEKKGIELLIQAWKKLSSDFAQWNLLIVGNGESSYIDRLKQMIEECNLSVAISAPVFGKDKIYLYQESSLFCLPSYSENFGMVVAEAMSCGVPVVTTSNCPWEILNTTNTGWCIDLSVESLEAALREAMTSDSAALFEMGQRASKLVRDNFDYKSVANQTASLYKWIIDGIDKPKFVR